MPWIDAMKAYAQQTGSWKVPKKGTPEYDAVKRIQLEMDAPPPNPVKTTTPPIPVVEKVRPKKLSMKEELEMLRAETAKYKELERAKYEAEQKAKLTSDEILKTEKLKKRTEKAEAKAKQEQIDAYAYAEMLKLAEEAKLIKKAEAKAKKETKRQEYIASLPQEKRIELVDRAKKNDELREVKKTTRAEKAEEKKRLKRPSITVAREPVLMAFN